MTENNNLSMYNYNTWANATLLNHLQQLPEGTVSTQIKSVFPSIFDTLSHIYIIDHGWYSILTEEYRSDDYEAIKNSVNSLVADTKDNTLQELGNKQQLLASKIRDFIMKHDMEHRGVYSGVPMSYADIIRHIVNHGTYHRGNITAMLHQLGHQGIPTDYGLYLYYSAQ